MTGSNGHDPFTGTASGRHAFLEGVDFTGAPAHQHPVYLPAPR